MKNKFKKGDIVKINKNATIEDFTKNHWHGCQLWTIEFIKQYADKNKTFEVQYVDCDNDLKLKGVSFKSIDNPTINGNIFTLVKRPTPILDKEEKEYLSAVIKPFRDKVVYIEKSTHFDKEFIRIGLNDDTGSLPDFEIGTMYKGMDLYKKYSLEELGL